MSKPGAMTHRCLPSMQFSERPRCSRSGMQSCFSLQCCSTTSILRLPSSSSGVAAQPHPQAHIPCSSRHPDTRGAAHHLVVCHQVCSGSARHVKRMRGPRTHRAPCLKGRAETPVGIVWRLSRRRSLARLQQSNSPGQARASFTVATQQCVAMDRNTSIIQSISVAWHSLLCIVVHD